MPSAVLLVRERFIREEVASDAVGAGGVVMVEVGEECDW